jgi:hypothetical protein
MKVITNQKIVKRYKTIGNFTLIGSLVVVAVGFYIMLKLQEPESNAVFWGAITMSVSFILMQIGIFFSNRFGISPQLHEQITQSLKGIENKNLLVHYEAIVPHLLVGPSGIWAIIPYPQKGKISYDEKKQRWVQKGVGIFQKLFMQEGLGRPDQEVKSYQKDLDKALERTFPNETPPKSNIVLVFTNPNAELNIENAPVPTIPLKKLKDFIRQQPKTNALSEAHLQKLKDSLPSEDIE